MSNVFTEQTDKYYVCVHSKSQEYNTGCPKINFTFLNVNNVRTNIRIATPAIYIDSGDL